VIAAPCLVRLRRLRIQLLKGWASGIGALVDGFPAMGRGRAQSAVVGRSGRGARHCRRCGRIFSHCGRFGSAVSSYDGAWELQRRGQRQCSDVRELHFRDQSMKEEQAVTAFWGWRQPLLLVACILLGTVGCAIAPTTNNDINGNCNGQGSSNAVTCNSVQPSNVGVAATASAPRPTAEPDGKQLGKYTVTMPAGYYVPIGPVPPTRSQLSATATGDLAYGSFSGVPYLSPVPPFSSIAPFNGVPTYHGCADDTDVQSSVNVGQGTAFCLYETQPALTIGGIVTYIDQSAINPDSITVQFTVWNGTS
jgi:hypothetical protein